MSKKTSNSSKSSLHRKHSANVVDNSPAQQAGIEIGWLILEANGKSISKPEELAAAARSQGPLKLKLVNPRNGEQKNTQVDW